MPERTSSIHVSVMKILREEAKCEPQLEARLGQLFRQNRKGFASAILRLEISMRERLCDLKYIERIQECTVEFLIWALERNAGPKLDEFAFASSNENGHARRERDSSHKRKEDIFDALDAASYVRLSVLDPDVMEHLPFRARMLEKFRKSPHLLQIFSYFWCRRASKRSDGH